jgi:hypothetical protein
MMCLNLPPELCYRPENMFFAGMTRPPKEPDVVRIMHVLEPVIAQLVPLHTGKIFRISCHPNGMHICVAVLPLLGDLVAIRKAGGFSAHSTDFFCFFYDLTIGNIDCLDHTGWNLRNGHQACTNGFEWKEATTKAECVAIRKWTGNDFSALF